MKSLHSSDGTNLLSVKGLDVRYGVSRALFNVSFDLCSGEILAVLGANGAGKSTLGRAISGLVTPWSGQILLNGRDITGSPSHEVRRLGLTYLPEGRGVFPTLSVMENLKMSVRWLGSKSDREAGIERVLALFPILGQRSWQLAGSLSGGEQQMLSLARGLATSPQVLIADEMSLGLAPLVVDAVFDQLQAAREAGVTIVLIEQFVHRALALADDVVVLQRGSVSWSGPCASTSQQEIVDRYLGDQQESREV